MYVHIHTFLNIFSTLTSSANKYIHINESTYLHRYLLYKIGNDMICNVSSLLAAGLFGCLSLNSTAVFFVVFKLNRKTKYMDQRRKLYKFLCWGRSNCFFHIILQKHIPISCTNGISKGL